MYKLTSMTALCIPSTIIGSIVDLTTATSGSTLGTGITHFDATGARDGT